MDEEKRGKSVKISREVRKEGENKKKVKKDRMAKNKIGKIRSQMPFHKKIKHVYTYKIQA